MAILFGCAARVLICVKGFSAEESEVIRAVTIVSGLMSGSFVMVMV